MECQICGEEIIWGCNYEYSDLYPYDEDFEGVVSQGHCPNCETEYESIMRVPLDVWNSKGENL